MNNIAVEIWDDECDLVTFYTVRKDGARKTETNIFFEKYEKDKDFGEATEELVVLLLQVMGNEYGAVKAFFNRHKNDIVGLPHKGKVTVHDVSFSYPEFPLRLYALRINDREDLVVLFNGGVKNARTDQESKDISLKFNEAMNFARRIEGALRDGMILIDEEQRKLKWYDGSDEIII